MITTKQTGSLSSRVRGPSSINVDHLECSLCHDLLLNPIACQTCEIPFCSLCITEWLANNPNKCPNQCEPYIQRKCPPFIAKLLAQLQISCSYQDKGCQQVILYEALNKHEIDCDYQSQTCPGCQSQILKKDFDDHKMSCASIELVCEECKIVYKRSDAAEKHTENICLREQVQQLRDESKKYKLEMQELSRQLNEIRSFNSVFTKIVINYADLPSATEKLLVIPKKYKGLKWTKLSYMHKLYARKMGHTSGYVTSFMYTDSPHIAIFSAEASISIENKNETITLDSLTACAAWNDNLQLIITGYRNSRQINTYTATLRFGKPEVFLLQWRNIDKIIFKSSGGTAHPGSGGLAGPQVILTQLTIGSVDL